jgi:hypothetical protein
VTVDQRTERRQNVRAFALVGAFFAVLALLGWIAASNVERIFGVGPGHLGSSLANNVPGGQGGACGEVVGQGWWWCGVEIDVGSGFGRYYALRETSQKGCWTAREVDRAGPTHGRRNTDVVKLTEVGRTIAGCVGLGDYLFPDHPDGAGGNIRPPRDVRLTR